MDYKQINIKYYVDTVNIQSDDFDYCSISKSHHGIQVNENLKYNEENIINKCDEISKLIYELREFLND